MQIANGHYHVARSSAIHQKFKIHCRDVFIGTGAKGEVGNPGVKGDNGPTGMYNHLYSLDLSQ